jgi:glycosyltransferase involved in cell wall biosynthesis
MDSKGLCDSMLFNKSVLIIGYAPPPLLGLRTEGGGLRNWGLAKGIKNNIPEYHVYYAYNTTLDDVLPDGVYEGISVFKWSDSNLEELIYQCSTIVLSYCMGSDTTKILQYVNNSQQVILDCYVPIYTEVSSRNASNSNLEYKDYQNSLHHWNNSFKRANVLVCANKHQENFYTGVLSALGVLNPLTYNNIRIRIIPYGIDNTQPDPKRTPISDLLICTSNTPFKLLWFGGIYPWFDVTILIDAMKILRDKHNIVLTMVGIQNPFITNPDFLKTVENVKKKIELENISDVINIHEWVDYESRADWYLDSDIIITINKPGIENEFAWRTRLVDYVWSGIPVLTNGNDPLGELLIKYGAAARCDIESAETLAESIQRLIIDKESLRKMSQRMKEYRPKLYWDKLVKPIVSDIIKHENYVALRN